MAFKWTVINGKSIYKPFEEKQLIKLNTRDLMELAVNHKRSGLKTALISNHHNKKSDS